MIPTAAVPPDRAWWLARLHPATRLGALPLALLTCLAAPAWFLPPLLGLTAAGLWRSGLPWRALGRSLAAWWPVAALVVTIHAFTTVSAAPLGHASWTGAWRGVVAVARVMASLICLRLLARTLALGDLVAALAWWGFGRLDGAAATRLGVLLAVALGAVPAVVAEGGRVTAALRLRQGRRQAGGPARRWWRRTVESTRLPLPLLEGLFRRAEALTLSLRGRLPQPAQLGPPPWRQIAALAVWLVTLVALACWRGRLS